MIHVIAALRAKKGRRNAILGAFRGIVDDVRAKPGCVEYSLAIHVESRMQAQTVGSGDDVIIVEKWADLNVFQQHVADPAYQSWYLEQVWPDVASASMQIFESTS
jgi:quinol monooxygenase YgiN